MLGERKEVYQKAYRFVSKLNNTQKLQLITGNDVSTTDGTFTALQFLDGSMGLQDYFYASAFSQSSALAMTWDREAMYAQARAVATEFYLKGIQVVDGPTTQPLGRTVWGGRLVETFGPDPYLNGIAAGLSAKAYVDTGVVAVPSTTSSMSKKPTEPPWAAGVGVVALVAVVLWETPRLVECPHPSVQRLETLTPVPAQAPTHRMPMTRPCTKHICGHFTTVSRMDWGLSCAP